MNKKGHKIFILVFISLFLMVCFSGCAQEGEIVPEGEVQEGYPMTVTDFVGRTVVIEEEPQSIISLRPSSTEILFALGLGDRVIGVTEYCYYPPEAAEKDKIGDFTTNVEKVIALDPDLILTFDQKDETVNALADYGYSLVSLKSNNIEEVLESIELVGRITNTYEQAQELTEEISREIEEIKEYTRELEEEDKPKVFVTIDTEELYTTGEGTFLNEIISTAGGINIGAEAGRDYFVISEEKLFQEDPDYILCTFPTKDQILERENWQDLKAVKKGQVYNVDGDIVSRPGPRVAQAVRHIFDIIHPDH